MERQARAFTADLRDAHKPSICAACLECFLDYIHPSVLKENVRILRTSHHDLLSAAMVFVTTPRTDASREETVVAVTAALSECSVPFGHRNQHRDATRVLFASSNLLNEVIGFLVELVYQCMGSLDRRALQNQRFSSRGLWPRSTEDLLPFGPEQSLLSLIHWLAVRDDTSVMTAFGDIFLTCRAELGPAIMKDTNRRAFVYAIAYQMQDSLKWLKKDSSEGIPYEPGNFSPQDRIITLNDGLYSILRVLSPDQLLLSTTPVPLVKGYELELLKSIEEAITLIENGKGRNRLISVTTTLHGSLGTPLGDRPCDLRLPILGRSGHASGVIQRMLCALRERHACGAAGCTVRERDVGRRLQRCSGCGIVEYCSKDRQRRHWKAPETPHNAVCASFKRLAPFLDLTEEDFGKEARGMNLDHDEFAFIGVHVRHGNVPAFTPGPQNIALKVQHMSTILRMQDSLVGDKDVPPKPDVVLEALRELRSENSPPSRRWSFGPEPQDPAPLVLSGHTVRDAALYSGGEAVLRVVDPRKGRMRVATFQRSFLVQKDST